MSPLPFRSVFKTSNSRKITISDMSVGVNEYFENGSKLLVMIILEIVFYKLNAYILLSIFGISDIGGSMVIHAFGAYFGISVARCLFKKGHIDNPAEGK